MSDGDQTTSTSSSGSSQSPLGVPVAIVIAGALIAAALYYSGDTGGAPGGAGTDSGRPTAQGDPAPVGDRNAGAAVGDVREVTADDHIRGAVNAKVTLIEYSDFECPFCERFAPTTKEVLDAYPDDVRLVYRHFPLESIHPNARAAAVASECAGEQGKFWEYHDYLFEDATRQQLREDDLISHAQAIGIASMSQFTACLQSEKYNDRVDADIEDASNAGGRGTPYTVVVGPNGETEAISGAQPASSLTQVIDRYLQ